MSTFMELIADARGQWHADRIASEARDAEFERKELEDLLISARGAAKRVFGEAFTMLLEWKSEDSWDEDPFAGQFAEVERVVYAVLPVESAGVQWLLRWIPSDAVEGERDRDVFAVVESCAHGMSRHTRVTSLPELAMKMPGSLTGGPGHSTT